MFLKNFIGADFNCLSKRDFSKSSKSDVWKSFLASHEVTEIVFNNFSGEVEQVFDQILVVS